MNTASHYTSDPNLSEPVDVLLEHALIVLSIEERSVIARRIANNLGFDVRPVLGETRKR